MRKILVLLLTPLLFIASCKTTRLSSALSIEELPVPPGTKKIADNLYFDQNEIRNLDYREYLHWTGKVFGINSAEYTEAFPDTTVWSRLDFNCSFLDEIYLRHYENRLLSVLGVSNEQAKHFSKWRSDRVMEFMLIRHKVLKWDPAPTKESAFTIEKYFTGNYRNLQPSPYLLYYPEYKLLDSAEDTRTGFKTICTYKKWK